MKRLKAIVVFAMALLLLVPPSMLPSSHREAPITALDRTADVTDWYAFVSYDHPDRVTMILNVDPFLEPSNGPNYFPFDPNVLYEMKVDNNRDGVEDVTFQFRFKTEIRQPGVFTGFVGGIAGIPPITSLDGPGAMSLGASLLGRLLDSNSIPGVTSSSRPARSSLMRSPHGDWIASALKTPSMVEGFTITQAPSTIVVNSLPEPFSRPMDLSADRYSTYSPISPSSW